MTTSVLTEVGPRTEKTGPVYKVSYSAHENPKLDGVTTLLELFEKSAEAHANRPALGKRRIGPDGEAGPYEFMTYHEVSVNVAALSSAYQQLGLQRGDRVGVFGTNCPEWMIAMQAANRTSAVCVPLYDTLGETAVEFIITHSEARLVMCAANKLQQLLKALSPPVRELLGAGGVGYWGEADAGTVQAFQAAGVRLLAWQEMLEMGRRKPTFPTRPSPGDLSTIMYTSGTTGDPKGVMLTHSAVVATIAAVTKFLSNFDEVLDHDDVYLSFLPLAHIFDRVVEEMFIHIGGSIGYFQGDVRKLVDDIGALRPTFFAGVPRVFERIYNGVNDQVRKAGGIKALLFGWAFARKLWYMRAGWRFDKAAPLSDLLVFNKVKSRLGGRVRVIISGGAPLPSHVEEFLKVAMCAPVVQGYGLTETCAGISISFPFDMGQTATVGPPLPHTELRLEAVPEMGYDPCPPAGQNPRGEVCVRGPPLFSGYFKGEGATKECMDSDGFFHTGDIGEILPSGALRIIDRKKNIFKLSQGEYIAVEKVENALKKSPEVEQVWVYGNSFESWLVAVVVPKKEALEAWGRAQGLPEAGDAKALCGLDAARRHILGSLKAAAKDAKLKSFEEVKAVHLDLEQWTPENDLVTPSLKLKRAPLLKHYKQQVDAMYVRLRAEELARGQH